MAHAHASTRCPHTSLSNAAVLDLALLATERAELPFSFSEPPTVGETDLGEGSGPLVNDPNTALSEKEPLEVRCSPGAAERAAMLGEDLVDSWGPPSTESLLPLKSPLKMLLMDLPMDLRGLTGKGRACSDILFVVAPDVVLLRFACMQDGVGHPIAWSFGHARACSQPCQPSAVLQRAWGARKAQKAQRACAQNQTLLLLPSPTLNRGPLYPPFTPKLPGALRVRA